MKRYLLGIDIGSGSCKASIMDDAGGIVGTASREYAPLCLRTGWFEQDPRDWLQAAVVCLQAAAKRAGIQPREISAVGATGQMKGATFIGRKGQIVRNSILWNDLRSVEEVRELRIRCGELLSGISFNPLNTTSTFAKALWLQKNEPSNWEATSKIAFPKDFIAFSLTGSVQTDLTEASGFCFFDARSQRWCPDEVLQRLCFPKEKLPDVVLPTRVVGGVSAEAAELTGLRPETPVVAGASDATAESLAIGLMAPHQCKIRLGTAGALVTVVDDLGLVEKGKYYVWSYFTPGRWMLDNNTRSCAQATTWFRSVFLKDIVSSEDAYRRCAEEADSVPVGSEGLFFHPYLLGEDSPYWDTRLTGSFFGFQAGHTRAHFARAVYEGTAYALRDAGSAYGDLSKRFSEYIMVGGGTKNPVWTSIIADVLGVSASIPLHSDAAMGACMLAAIGTGVFRDYREAIEKCVRAGTQVHCDAARHREYDALFERYRSMKRVFDGVHHSRKEK